MISVYNDTREKCSKEIHEPDTDQKICQRIHFSIYSRFDDYHRGQITLKFTSIWHTQHIRHTRTRTHAQLRMQIVLSCVSRCRPALWEISLFQLILSTPNQLHFLTKILGFYSYLCISAIDKEELLPITWILS